MKKKTIASAALSMALVASMGMTAFAADPVTVYGPDPNKTVTIDVNGSVANTVKKADVEKNYYVELSWAPKEDSNLTYTIGKDAYTWNIYDADGTVITDNTKAAVEAGYGFTGEGTWTGKAAFDITVKNWSNGNVKATASAAGETGIQVTSAEKSVVADALSNTASITDYVEGTSTIGTNKVTLAANNKSTKTLEYTIDATGENKEISGKINTTGKVATITVKLEATNEAAN